MDARKLAEFLRATGDPTQQKQAEEQLGQIHKIIGFAPALLQLVISTDVEEPVRQAAAIYLKNLISTSWVEQESENGSASFSIHEQDRAFIRGRIVEAVVHARGAITAQLEVCVLHITKHDFPGRWTQVVDKILMFMATSETSYWTGAFRCLYQLVKNFEYKQGEERAPLNEAMKLLFPSMYQLMLQISPNNSEESVVLQKLILKIYFALTQFTLSLDSISKEVFSQWMQVILQIVNREVPLEIMDPNMDDEDRAKSVWWKIKKWALRMCLRYFERYGSPGGVQKEYKEFANWYLPTFSAVVIEAILKMLDQYHNKIFVSPIVMQISLNYIEQCVSHSHAWKILKPDMFTIIRNVIFPLLCHKESDEVLYHDDPVEYIKVKFDVFDDFDSPVSAAQVLLHSACKKRKEMLQKSMQFCIEVLNTPNVSALHKDGALHMIGSLSEILLKNGRYKAQAENMLIRYVFPELDSQFGYMRAKACWVLQQFAEIDVKQDQLFLVQAIEKTTKLLLNVTDLPVRVQAAIALQNLLSSQEKAQKHIVPLIKNITHTILEIIRETESDELTMVLQELVCIYSEQLMPIAAEICQHLANSLRSVFETDNGNDDKAMTAMGLLNTLETLLSVMEEQPQILAQVEPTVIQVITYIFNEGVIEFYEEAMSLVYDLTTKNISGNMWKVFEMMYALFTKDGFDYFTDMMPSLHNYVTVDTPAFLSNQDRLLAVFNMCKTVLEADSGEDPECHAAKLLEVVVLQCKGQIDQAIPEIIELILRRLTRQLNTSELKGMCMQVVIAVFYYNPNLCLNAMASLQETLQSTQPIPDVFIKQWIGDMSFFLGLHDRKLCILGLCTLISMGQSRPAAVNECAQQIMPSMIELFQGLKNAYVVKAAEEQEEEEAEEEESDEEEVLSSDEDEIDGTSQGFLEDFQNKATQGLQQFGFAVSANFENGDDQPDDDDSDNDCDESTLESYTTPLDFEENSQEEYVIFQQVMQSIECTDQAWYQALTCNLSLEQQNALREIIELADRRKAAVQSKKIEQNGGFVFQSQTIPTSFNFSQNSK